MIDLDLKIKKKQKNLCSNVCANNCLPHKFVLDDCLVAFELEVFHPKCL